MTRHGVIQVQFTRSNGQGLGHDVMLIQDHVKSGRQVVRSIEAQSCLCLAGNPGEGIFPVLPFSPIEAPEPVCLVMRNAYPLAVMFRCCGIAQFA